MAGEPERRKPYVSERADVLEAERQMWADYVESNNSPATDDLALAGRTDIRDAFVRAARPVLDKVSSKIGR